MSTKDNGGPAFPTTPQNYDDMDPAGAGMTLRDYFAAKAMQGNWATGNTGSAPEHFRAAACRYYAMADVMMEARKK
jgi:hypothetical protein